VKKKERFIATYNNKTYEIAGRWEDSICPFSGGYPRRPVPDLYCRCLQTGELKQETIEKRALFGRKIANLKDLKDLTQAALKKGRLAPPTRWTKRFP